jgi:hypothetical protein
MGFFVKGCITSAARLINNFNPEFRKNPGLQNHSCWPDPGLVSGHKS